MFFTQPASSPVIRPHPGCFVTGTDTNVGKTVVTAALASCLRGRRVSVGIMKPIETGYGSAGSPDSDAERLRWAAGVSDDLNLVVPYRFPAPLAPLAASRQAGETIELHRIISAYEQLAARHGLLLVEGAGGVLAPISEQCATADLIAKLGLPALIVGRPGLGGINHALLTLEALERRHISVLGIVLNLQSAPKDTQEVPAGFEWMQIQSTTDFVRQFCGHRVFGPLKHIADLDKGWRAGVEELASDPWIQSLADLVAPHAR